jgi:uncharacterized Zn finger protein (UPF0148 family)
MHTNTCAICGKSFESKRLGAVTCGVSCRATKSRNAAAARQAARVESLSADADKWLDAVIENSALIDDQAKTIAALVDQIEALQSALSARKSVRREAVPSDEIDALRSREWAVAARERAVADREEAVADREEAAKEIKPAPDPAPVADSPLVSSDAVKKASDLFGFCVMVANWLKAGKSRDQIAADLDASRDTVDWALGVAGYPADG